MKKKALIFGVTGQDGYYLARFLLTKNYEVHGVKRRSSSIPINRIASIVNNKNFKIHYGDLSDSLSIHDIISRVKPNEIYNLAAQSHVGVSFYIPEYTADINGLGALRILETIRILNKKIKFYQAGTSEMFGKTKKKFQDEKTSFNPQSPYGAAKLFAHLITSNYRDAYNLFACNGILFNHESPIRGENFVTKKIISGMCKIKLGLQDKITLGNLYAKRDWGHAEDYVEAIYRILQRNKPDDYVIATGKQMTIKQFINLVAKELNVKIFWDGCGLKEKAFDLKTKKCIIDCNKIYFRPLEVDHLKGNASKARKFLKWKPKKNIYDLIKEMISEEIRILKI